MDDSHVVRMNEKVYGSSIKIDLKLTWRQTLLRTTERWNHNVPILSHISHRQDSNPEVFNGGEWNRPISQVPECIRQISHNASFCNRNVHTCAHFCYKMVHCVIWDWCIVGFVPYVDSIDRSMIGNITLVHSWYVHRHDGCRCLVWQ